MSTADVNGLKLHYWRIGQGSDVVMLHGLIGNLAVWHLRIVPMMRNQFRLTTYDLRGHGFSEMPLTGYTSRNLALDLEGLLDVLEMDKVHLVGHSFGADVALHFAILNPDRVNKLVLIEPGLAALVSQRKHEDWEGWTYWVNKLEEVGVKVPPDKRSDMQYLFRLSLETPKFYGPARGLPRKRGSLLKLINETTVVQDYEVVDEMTQDRIRTVQHPSLVIYGNNSHFLGTYYFLRDALPNATTLLIPGGEHFGPLEFPELLVEHMQSFFLSSETKSNPEQKLE